MATDLRSGADVESRPIPDEVALEDTDPDVRALDELAARRLRVALSLTAAMLVVYFGFILLIAFAKGFLSERIVSGLTVGMALGVCVILATWVLTWIYVSWANRVYEPEVARLREAAR
jgi:uncharacterized membrane protein (DUF485 family)